MEIFQHGKKEDIISILGNKFGIVKPALLDELEKVKRVESLKIMFMTFGCRASGS